MKNKYKWILLPLLAYTIAYSQGYSSGVTQTQVSSLQAQLDTKSNAITNEYTITAPEGGAVRVFDPNNNVISVSLPILYSSGTIKATSSEVSSDLYGDLFNSINDNVYYTLPQFAEEYQIHLHFTTNAASATDGARIRAYEYSINPDTHAYVSTVQAANYASTNGTLVISATLDPSHYGNIAREFRLVAATPAGDGLSTFKEFLVYGVSASLSNTTADVLATLIEDAQNAQ